MRKSLTADLLTVDPLIEVQLTVDLLTEVLHLTVGLLTEVLHLTVDLLTAARLMVFVEVVL